MAFVKSIFGNIEQNRITEFLRKQGIPRERIDKAKEKHLLLEELLDDNFITEEALNEFLYSELMYGHRRLIRIYELKAARKIRKIDAWDNLLKIYGRSNLDFNRIVTTNMVGEEKLRVAAIKSEEDNGILKRVEILFVFNMIKGLRKKQEFENVYSYIPVVFDFKKRTLMLRVWNREQGIEANTPNDQLGYVFGELEKYLEFEIKPISNNPQHVLYLMSKDLFEDFFNQLPNINDVEGKRACLDDITNQMLTGILLKNAEEKGQKITMNPEVINVQEEVYKLLQQVALFDYLKDNEITSLLKNTDKYVSRIRFNDKDNLSASLTGEKGVRCIYDAKTFMCIRNSLDLVARIVSIVVTFVKDKKHMHVKYESVDSRFLNIHILHEKYYTQEEFEKIWELYKTYEAKSITGDGAVYTENNAKAM